MTLRRRAALRREIRREARDLTREGYTVGDAQEILEEEYGETAQELGIDPLTLASLILMFLRFYQLLFNKS